MAIKLNSKDTSIVLAALGLMEDVIDMIGLEAVKKEVVKADLTRLSASYRRSFEALKRWEK